MDPQVTWHELIEAYHQGNADVAFERAVSLLEWLQKGGVSPQVLSDYEMTDDFNRVVALAVGLHVVGKTIALLKETGN